MRIQHNILAMNAYRNYNNNTSALGKNLEKLSSGYKINRAGDDAAGLAISEKMRAQITGLNAAQKNVKDGISLVKTAEGAMQEIQDMLNRMDYLATQSANGTYDNEVDRANLQKEVDALKTEINRIADSANFNGIKLLDGSLDSDADLSTKVDFAIGDTLPKVGQTLGTDTVLHNKALTSGGTEFDVDLHNFTFDAATGDTMTMKVGDTTFELTATTGVAGGLSGASLANAILGGQTGVDVKITQGDGTVTELTGGTAITGLQINGQDFSVSAPDRLGDESNALHFAQINAPTSKDDEVNGAMEVTLSGVKADVAGQYNVTIGADTTTTFAAGEFNVAGVTVAVASGDDAAAILTALADKASDFEAKGYEVSVDGNKLVLTATTAGTAGAAAPTIAAFTPDGVAATAAVTEDTEGKAAVKAVYTAEITDTSNDGVAVTTGVAVSAGAGNSDVAETIFDDDWKVAYTNGATTGTLTFTAVTAGAVSGGPTVAGVDLSVATTGADAVTGTYTLTLEDWDGKSDVGIGGVTVAAAAITAGGAIGTNYKVQAYDADTNELTIVAVTAGVDAGKATLTTTDVNYTKTADPVQDMTITTAIKPADGGPIGGMTEGAKGDWNVSTTNIKNVTSDGINRLASTYFTLTEEMATEGSKVKVGDSEYTFTADKSKIGTTGYVDISSGDINQIAKNLTEAAKDNTLYTVGNDGNRMTFTETLDHAGFGGTATYPADDWDLSVKENIEKSLGFTAGASSTKSGKALTLQIGDTSDKWNQMEVSVGDMHTKAMGIKDGKSIADIDISTQAGAAEAVDVIKGAINYVSSVRGDLGAIQNRLEHTQNNLSVMAENIQDAESTIRDTDVAEEMMSYVKNNILVQSAQAMLAQANQVPQGVLQLLG